MNTSTMPLIFTVLVTLCGCAIEGSTLGMESSMSTDRVAPATQNTTPGVGDATPGAAATTPSPENPLGTLIECDEVEEEIVSYRDGIPVTKRRDVAYVQVENPLSVAITLCDSYWGYDGEITEVDWSILGTTCTVVHEVTYTPDLKVRVECGNVETHPNYPSFESGHRRVYLRTDIRGGVPSGDHPLGDRVDCDEVLETFTSRGAHRLPVHRKIAKVPVQQPASVTISRCGSYFESSRVGWEETNPECVSTKGVELTPASEVIVECKKKTTLPVGYLGVEEGEKAYWVEGYDDVYVNISPSRERGSSATKPLGRHVECNEVVTWEFSPGTVHETLLRVSAAYVPVADPTAVTMTLCDRYSIWRSGSTSSDLCIINQYVRITEDFEVFVQCEKERSGWLNDTRGFANSYVRLN